MGYWLCQAQLWCNYYTASTRTVPYAWFVHCINRAARPTIVPSFLWWSKDHSTSNPFPRSQTFMLPKSVSRYLWILLLQRYGWWCKPPLPHVVWQYLSFHFISIFDILLVRAARGTIWNRDTNITSPIPILLTHPANACRGRSMMLCTHTSLAHPQTISAFLGSASVLRDKRGSLHHGCKKMTQMGSTAYWLVSCSSTATK